MKYIHSQIEAVLYLIKLNVDYISFVQEGADFWNSRLSLKENEGYKLTTEAQEFLNNYKHLAI